MPSIKASPSLEDTVDSETHSCEDERKLKVREALRAPIPSSLVSKRQQAGTTILYLEGYQAINQANRIFGEDGWSVNSVQVDGTKNADGKTIYYAVVSVVALGVLKTDVGCGVPAGDKPEAHDTAIKGAVTDAMKRALRQFGNQFGNSLYEKDSVANTAMKTSRTAASKSVVSAESQSTIQCEVEGCTNKLNGYKGTTGAVSAQDQAEKTKSRFGKALCLEHFKKALSQAAPNE